MVLTEVADTDLRDTWGLAVTVKVIGLNDNDLGGADEINLYDAVDSAGFSLLVNPTSLVLEYTGGGLGAAAAAVPEPTSALLASLAMRRKQR